MACVAGAARASGGLGSISAAKGSLGAITSKLARRVRRMIAAAAFFIHSVVRSFSLLRSHGQTNERTNEACMANCAMSAFSPESRPF